jgi:hypothetical protein
MLSNALLHYSYLPLLVRSLCSLKLKPVLQLNTCLYLLTQTFRIIKEPTFLTVLFASLFASHLPKTLTPHLEPKGEVAAPCFYRPKYHPKPLKDYTLVEYLLEYYNMYDFEVFLIHGTSHDIGFIKDLRKDY